jgi:hypothetical protein
MLLLFRPEAHATFFSIYILFLRLAWPVFDGNYLGADAEYIYLGQFYVSTGISIPIITHSFKCSHAFLKLPYIFYIYAVIFLFSLFMHAAGSIAFLRVSQYNFLPSRKFTPYNICIDPPHFGANYIFLFLA